MEKVCKAAVVTYNGQVECRQVEMPELKDNEVLVKVHRSLISPGTEMNNPRALREKPAEDKNHAGQFGYSSAGEIIAVKGDAKDLKVGMRVACMGSGAKHASYNAVPLPASADLKTPSTSARSMLWKNPKSLPHPTEWTLP